MEPGLSRMPGGLPICAVVSVWPKPSRMVNPHAALTCSMTSGLSGSPRFSQHHRPAPQILLYQHAPYGRRSAESGDAAANELIEQRRGVEALKLVGQHRGFGVPGRK